VDSLETELESKLEEAHLMREAVRGQSEAIRGIPRLRHQLGSCGGL